MLKLWKQIQHFLESWVGKNCNYFFSTRFASLKGMILIMKKHIISLLMIVVLLFPVTTYAAEEEEELVNVEEIVEEIEQASSTSVDTPNINSRAAIVIERKSQIPIYEKNSNERRKMASTTKIMTSIIVVERGNLEETVIVSKKAGGTGGSRLGLKAGDKVKVKDLLYGLMLCSGNDAAVALAEHIGGSVENFAELMNKKAEELGLKNTHFVTPHGLDEEEHYTTAYELATLTNYALNIPEIAKIVRTERYTVWINGYAKEIRNTNELLGYLDGVYGVKTGFTNGANRCLVTAVKRGDLDIICVVLGADTKKYRTKDSIQLIEYAFKNYEIVPMEESIEKAFHYWKVQNEKRIKVFKGMQSYPNLVLDKIPYSIYPLKKGQKDKVKIEIESIKEIEAPVEKQLEIGKLTIKAEGKELFQVNILTENEIARKNIWDYFKENIITITKNPLLDIF